MVSRKVKVIHYGLGPIGMETARLVSRKQGMRIVGAVDISPALLGRDLGEVIGNAATGVKVSGGIAGLGKSGADVVIHTAGSRINSIFDQLAEIIRAGMHIVSSSEELLYPSGENKLLADKLNKLAMENGVSVLGTGVNPGFVMDALPLYMTTVCQEVTGIHVTRVVDAATRRLPLQRKIGAGMTKEEFQEKIEKKLLGHVGLLESLYLLSDRLAFELDEVTETIEPVIAGRPLTTGYIALKPGDVAGIKHVAKGRKNGRDILVLDLRMFVGAEEPHDSIRIKGLPEINLRIEGGVAGDQATAAVLVNSVAALLDAKPGLITVNDLKSPHFSR